MIADLIYNYTTKKTDCTTFPQKGSNSFSRMHAYKHVILLNYYDNYTTKKTICTIF
jgi:hypothetical protein